MNTVTSNATSKIILGYDGICKSIAYNHGKLLYGINLDVRPDGTRIILKTLTRGRGEICFINASSLERCLEVLESFVETSSAVGVQWKPDKYFKP